MVPEPISAQFVLPRTGSGRDCARIGVIRLDVKRPRTAELTVGLSFLSIYPLRTSNPALSDALEAGQSSPDE